MVSEGTAMAPRTCCRIPGHHTKAEDGLTRFQHEAFYAVTPFIELKHVNRISSESGEGDYLVAPLGQGGAELYLYSDEAGIFGAAPEVWFEAWNFRTPAELLDALIQECSARTHGSP